MNDSSLIATGLSAGLLLALIFVPLALTNWRAVKTWWHDVSGPLP